MTIVTPIVYLAADYCHRGVSGIRFGKLYIRLGISVLYRSTAAALAMLSLAMKNQVQHDMDMQPFK